MCWIQLQRYTRFRFSICFYRTLEEKVPKASAIQVGVSWHSIKKVIWTGAIIEQTDMKLEDKGRTMYKEGLQKLQQLLLMPFFNTHIELWQLCVVLFFSQ